MPKIAELLQETKVARERLADELFEHYREMHQDEATALVARATHEYDRERLAVLEAFNALNGVPTISSIDGGAPC